MRCPKCRNDHKKKYGLTCSCGYQFVFDPAIDGKMRDGKFLAIAGTLFLLAPLLHI